jgi:hypothetical protein
VIGVIAISVAVIKFWPSSPGETPASTQCKVKPFREEEAAGLIKEGAAIVYHRTAGPECVDQLFAIFPDGRVTASDGVNKTEKQNTPADVERLLTAISVEHNWFVSKPVQTVLCTLHCCFVQRTGKSCNRGGRYHRDASRVRVCIG